MNTNLSESSLVTALQVAIDDQEKYERERLKYTRDSGILAQWREEYKRITGREYKRKDDK